MLLNKRKKSEATLLNTFVHKQKSNKKIHSGINEMKYINTQIFKAIFLIF